MNADKVPIIVTRDGFGGILGVVNVMYNMAQYYIANGFSPIVYLPNDIDDPGNKWTKYFEQPCSVDLDEIDKNAVHKVKFSGWLRQYTDLPETDFRRIIRFKPDIAKEFDIQYENHLAGKRTLGIKLRGTDYVRIRPKNHFIQPEPGMVFDEVSKLLETEKIDVIYLATDSADYYETAKSRFGDLVYSYQKDRFRNEDVNCWLTDHMRDSKIDIYNINRQYIISVLLFKSCDFIFTGQNSSTDFCMNYWKEEKGKKIRIYSLGRF